MTFNPAKVPRKLYISVLGEEGPTLLSRSVNARDGGKGCVQGVVLSRQNRVILAARKGGLGDENHDWLQSPSLPPQPSAPPRDLASVGREPGHRAFKKESRATLQIRFILLPRSKG